MTLENTLRQQLNKPQIGGTKVSVGDWTAFLHFDKNDSLSCALNEFSLEKSTAMSEDLDAWAERIAASATGLLEPLRLIEIDRHLGNALLRSDARASRTGGLLL